MLDLFYNGVLLCLVLFWLLSASRLRSLHFISLVKANSKALSIVLWVIFLIFVAGYCIYFNQLSQMHDIPNAVNSAVGSQDNDLNPYNHTVVPRFGARYSSTVSWTYGSYNYLPFDLDVYYFFQKSIGFLGMPLWLVVTNIMFSAAAFLLLRELLRVSWRCYVPLAGVVVLFYSFDNVSLTLLLVVASMFIYRKLDTNNRTLAIVLMGLAMMTKIHAAIPFCVLVLYELQRFVHTRNQDGVLKTYASVTASGVIATALMLPYGIGNVVKSAVLFNMSVVARIGTSSGGTLLTELPLTTTEYSVLAVAFILVAMVASLRFSSLNDRMIIVSVVLLLVAVKSSQALLTIPGIFLVLKMSEISRPEPGSNEAVAGLLAPVWRRFRWRA